MKKTTMSLLLLFIFTMIPLVALANTSDFSGGYLDNVPLSNFTINDPTNYGIQGYEATDNDTGTYLHWDTVNRWTLGYEFDQPVNIQAVRVLGSDTTSRYILNAYDENNVRILYSYYVQNGAFDGRIIELNVNQVKRITIMASTWNSAHRLYEFNVYGEVIQPQLTHDYDISDIEVRASDEAINAFLNDHGYEYFVPVVGSFLTGERYFYLFGSNSPISIVEQEDSILVTSPDSLGILLADEEVHNASDYLFSKSEDLVLLYTDVGLPNTLSPQFYYEKPMQQNLIFNIYGDEAVNLYEEFTIDVRLLHAVDIYAQDIKLNYDSSLFELVKVDIVAEGLGFYHTDESISGSLRYIVASRGQQYGINGETNDIVRITLKAINVGVGNIEVIEGLVADHLGNEYVTEVGGLEITVNGFNPDVNRNGIVSLGDLAIAAFDFGRITENLANPNSDVNLDGEVSDIDLNLIVEAILTQETVS